MGLLYNYTYLNANGYLQKFRNALGAPLLDRATLTKILKIFNDRHKLVRFIVPAEPGGPKCLYYKDTLNAILGIDRTGYGNAAGKSNTLLSELRSILSGIEEKEIMKSQPVKDEPVDYSSDEEDMQKMSDRLIYNDNYGMNESKKRSIFITEGQLSYLHDHKMKNSKNIIISEKQEKELKKSITESYFVETDKVKAVRDFLDSHFERGANPQMGSDGYPSMKPIMGLKIGDPNNSTKPMTPSQVFYMLQDKFKGMYSDTKQRDAFLKQVLIDWYNKAISYDGMLTRNNV
jgi:hypothetical protein